MEGTPNFAALYVCPPGQSLQMNWRPTATQGKLSNVYVGTCLNPCHTWQCYPLPAQQLPATSPNTVSLPCRRLEESEDADPSIINLSDLSTPACCCKQCCCAKAPFMLPMISPNLCLLIPYAGRRGEQSTLQHPQSLQPECIPRVLPTRSLLSIATAQSPQTWSPSELWSQTALAMGKSRIVFSLATKGLLELQKFQHIPNNKPLTNC